jgi:hypothetical protein
VKERKVRRLLVVVAVAALMALPGSHLLRAAKPDGPPEKVSICHIPEETAPLGLGFVISVSKNAQDAHLNHGDCLASDADVADDGSCMCLVDPIPE